VTSGGSRTEPSFLRNKNCCERRDAAVSSSGWHEDVACCPPAQEFIDEPYSRDALSIHPIRHSRVLSNHACRTVPNGVNCRTRFATTRLMVVEFSITVYLEEHGTLPTSLEALELDNTVLIDPFSANRARLQYRRSTGEFALYSVGPDGDDDGGGSGPTNQTPDGDHFLQD
jgi:hypothetical protein